MFSCQSGTLRGKIRLQVSASALLNVGYSDGCCPADTPIAAAFFLPNRALPDIRCGRSKGRFSEREAARSAAIAQLVEHVIRNDGVTGSNPVCGTSFPSRSAATTGPKPASSANCIATGSIGKAGFSPSRGRPVSRTKPFLMPGHLRLLVIAGP